MKKLFNSIGSILREFLSDETKRLSSKRLVGIMCAICLCVVLYKNSGNNPLKQNPSDILVETVGLVTIGCLGLSSLDKYTLRKNSKDSDNKNQTP